MEEQRQGLGLVLSQPHLSRRFSQTSRLADVLVCQYLWQCKPKVAPLYPLQYLTFPLVLLRRRGPDTVHRCHACWPLLAFNIGIVYTVACFQCPFFPFSFSFGTRTSEKGKEHSRPPRGYQPQFPLWVNYVHLHRSDWNDLYQLGRSVQEWYLGCWVTTIGRTMWTTAYLWIDQRERIFFFILTA